MNKELRRYYQHHHLSKTIPGQNTNSIQAELNGQEYSLSEISDPSGVVTVQGYANASDNSPVMSPAPASASISNGVLATVVVVGLFVLVGGYIAIRTRDRVKTTAPSPTTLPV